MNPTSATPTATAAAAPPSPTFTKGTGMPPVLTSSPETNTQIQGPLMPELEVIAPEEFAARIKRTGLVNAWDDEDFANAGCATGKRNFVMAGVTTDVCTVAPAISAVEDGFNVRVDCDARGLNWHSGPRAVHG